MGEDVPPQGPFGTHGHSSSEIARFIRAFGAAGAKPQVEEQIRALETLLTSLAGVRSARIATTEAGDVGEIHVVSDGAYTAAQLRRNVQSALLATHDLHVDPELISIVPLKDPADDRAQVRRKSVRDARVRLDEIHYQQEGFKIVAHVELGWEGKIFHGLSHDADTADGKIMATARATLDALEKLTEHRAAFFLEALETVRSSRQTVIVGSLRVVSNRHRGRVVGCAIVEEDPHYAAAQAVLDAVNRSLARLIAAPQPSDPESHPRAPGRALSRSS